MKIIKYNFLALIIALFSFSAMTFAQIDRSKAPVPGPAPEINIPEPTVFDLDNGLKVIVSSNDKLPRVSFNLVMGSDPKLEGEKAGLAGLAGSLILSGTTNRDKDELDAEKDFIGATLSASSNSIYYSSLTKHMDKGLDLMLDVLHNANFPQSEFDRIVKQEESSLISLKSDPDGMASNATSKVIFGDDHPNGEVMTPESLENITRQDVVDFYKERFIPAGSYLVIVGDITPEDAKKVAEKRFGSWEGGVPHEKDFGKGQFPDKNSVYFVERPGAVQSVITVAFPVDMKPGHEDHIKLSVLNKLFGGGGFGTRLMQNLREDKAWTYGAYSRLNIGRTGSYFSASGSFASEVTDSAIVEYLYEINRITKDLVSEEELELNKASMAGNFARSLESPRTIANFALRTYRNDLPKDYYQNYLKKLNAVSKEDILEVAKKYITPENLNIIVVGNADVVDKIKQFDGSKEIVELDAFGNLKKEKELEEADITKSEVIEKYLMAVTQSSDMDEANKKIGEVKTMKQNVIMKPQQAPVEIKMTVVFEYPHSRFSKVEFQGMQLQKEVFNGEKGFSETMNEAGGKDKTEFSEEEIEYKRKTGGLFPELAMVCDGIEYDLLGIEEIAGKKFYAIHYKGDRSETTSYYSVDDFMKRHTNTLTITDEGGEEGNSNFSNFKEVNGILFPHKTTQLMGGQGFEAEIKEFEINGKIDNSVFDLD